MQVNILKPFKPLFENNHTYFVYYGGRGGGKTESIAQSLVLLAYISTQKILCIRESQCSLAESVKSVIESWIDRLGLWRDFRVLNNAIKCDRTGSEFIFMGMRSHNAVNVKSIHGVTITWIEEAEAFSKRSWDLLVPSVTRTKDPKIIVSFNPYRDDDIIYKTFITSTPPPKSHIQKITYKDNPYFKSTNLESQRLHDESVLSDSEYKHKWEGELKIDSELALFDSECLTNIQNFIQEPYSRIIVSADPATTNKDKSNEYGIIVMGLNASGKCVLLDDFSGNFTPTDFASMCIKAYHNHNADAVVVEVNNGGDFIKSAILSLDSRINVVEVRATRDKVHRALPVANLAKIGMISHDPRVDDSKLVRQMKLITQKGFLGERGESPDRLDAYVWAVYELKGLSDKVQESTLFKLNDFDKDVSYKSRATPYTYCAIYCDNAYISIVKCILLENQTLKRKINIIDSAIFLVTDSINILEFLSNCNIALIPDTPKMEGLPILKELKKTRIKFIDYENSNLDNLVLENLANIKQYIQIDKLPIRSFLNQTGELIKLDLTSFKIDENKDSGLIRALMLLLELVI